MDEISWYAFQRLTEATNNKILYFVYPRIRNFI